MAGFDARNYPSASDISWGLDRAKAVSDMSKGLPKTPQQLLGEPVSKSIERAMRPTTLRAIQGMEQPFTQALRGVVSSAIPAVQARNDAAYMASALSGLSKGVISYHQILGADATSQALRAVRASSSYQFRSFDVDFSRMYGSMSTLSGVLLQSAGFYTASHTKALLRNVARSVTADLNSYGLRSSTLNLAREMQRAQSLNRLPRNWIITAPYRAPTVSPEYEPDTMEPETGAEIFVPFSNFETATNHKPSTPIQDAAGSLQSWVRENHVELNTGLNLLNTGMVATGTGSVMAMAVLTATGVIVTIWVRK